MEKPTPKKKSFGGCNFSRTSPPASTFSQATKTINVDIPFEDALKLNVAIDECVRRLNSYNRRSKDGRRTALSLSIKLDKNRITIIETKLPSKDSAHKIPSLPTNSWSESN
jgi:hypothetical protein